MPLPFSAPRHIVERSDHHMCVTLPAKPNIFQVLWFCLWMVGWAYMLLAIFSLFETMNIIVFILILLFLPVLLMMGAIVIHSFLWHIAGVEIVEVHPETMIIVQKIFGWERLREYILNEVTDLRVAVRQSGYTPLGTVQKFLRLDGMIAFDYEGDHFRFGYGIEEADAKQIVQEIRQAVLRQKLI